MTGITRSLRRCRPIAPSSSSGPAWPVPRPPKAPDPPASRGGSSSSATSLLCPTNGHHCPRPCSAARPRRSRRGCTVPTTTSRTASSSSAVAPWKHSTSTGSEVRLDGGESVRFTAVVLATGAAPRRLDIAGATSPACTTSARSTTPCGWPRPSGPPVESPWSAPDGSGRRSPRRLGRWAPTSSSSAHRVCRSDAVLGDEVGAVFATLHADHGAQLRMGTGVAELRGGSSVDQVVLTNGAVEDADLVVVGIGVTHVSSSPCRRARRRQRHRHRRPASGERTRRLCRRRCRVRLAPALSAPPARRTLGERPQSGGHCRRPTRREASRPTTACRTSSPTSTTSAWSTSATRSPTIRRSSAAAPPILSSSPSRSATASSRRR